MNRRVVQPLPIPGLFITGTDTGIGKTVVAGAVANWFFRHNNRPSVFKPLASGCEHRREGLVSEDAEFLAECAKTPHPLDLICPIRLTEPLAPAVAAKRAGVAVEWEAVQRSIDIMSRNGDVMIIEGAGGVMVPLDEQTLVLHLLRDLQCPAVVVARPGLGTINHTLLTIEAIRHAGCKVAGVVINRYPTDLTGIAEETSPREIEKWGKVPVLAIVPDEPVHSAHLPRGIVAAVDKVDWHALAVKGMK